MGARVRQWTDEVEVLGRRTWPAVRQDQRERVGLLRLHVDEVDVLAVDLGHELRMAVQLRLLCTPVEAVRPVVGELAYQRQGLAVAEVLHHRLWPACGDEAAAQVGKLLFRDGKSERVDGRVHRSSLQ